jgi:hypothetical protein
MTSIGVSVELSGDTDLQAKIMAALGNMAPELEAALIKEGEMIMEKSQELVPVDYGDLKNSGSYYGSEVSKGSVEVRYGYGGAATSYAVIQHENPEFRHTEGQTWKYLEIPVFEAVQGMGPRLAASVSAGIAARFRGA